MMIKNCMVIAAVAICLLACGNNKKQTSLADTNKTVKDTSGQHLGDRNDTTVHHTMASDTGSTSSPDWLITPGKGIGHIVLDEDVNNVMKQLGKPDSSDAAMGSSLLVWFAGHNPSGNRTVVFAHHNMGGKDETVSHVRKVLVTSPKFKTADGLGVGSAEGAIRKVYTLKASGSYTNKSGKVQVYTDLAKGISFEIDGGGNCVGVVVHKVTDTAAAYLNMH
ncbi:hypothetical protein [Mucilaginibacter celer]|uniref:Uncharacterized protein n=1 Tax=Mucilaginibacter celer TaxID=2305508 RepID=A0A494W297_9SPHI|nr:hypothetical protein [Mucilaginibacter celer]AYL97678.1 hypothetical protein HYN43_021330 [Mucilaginibacter celer]